MGGTLPPQKSETLAYVAGGNIRPKDWIKARAPDGGRTVIDRIWARFVGTLTTATAALLGEDVPRIFGLGMLTDKTGLPRINLYGDMLRVANFQIMGPGKVLEHADTGVGAAQAIDAWLCFSLHKPFEYDGNDWSIGVDDFDGIQLTAPAAADLSLGTSVVSAIAGNYYFIAECHSEHSVIAKCRDSLSWTAFGSAVQASVPLVGKPRDVIIHQRGAAGGGSLANMPTVRCAELGMSVIARADFQTIYTAGRDISPGAFATQGAEMRTDPFRTAAGVAGASALSVLRCDPNDSNTAGEWLQRMTIDCDGSTVSATGLNVIHRQMIPQTDGELAALSARFGTDGWRMKTADKSKRDPNAWTPSQRRALPKSAPLKGGTRT